MQFSVIFHSYNQHAEKNNIIILYPQATSTPLNPNGCFDWCAAVIARRTHSPQVGIHGPAIWCASGNACIYLHADAVAATKEGVQVFGVRNMLYRLTGGQFPSVGTQHSPEHREDTHAA